MNIEMVKLISVKTTDEIINMISTGNILKWEAIKALGLINTIESKNALYSLLEMNDIYIQRAILEELGVIENIRALDQLIHKLEDKTDEYFIRTALGIIEKRSIHSLHEYVINHLDTINVYTNECAIRALNSIWNNDFDLVLKVMKSKNNANIQKKYYEVLYNHANRINWYSIYQMIFTSEVSQIRLLACKLLLKYYNNDYKNDILRFCNDSDGHIRKIAIEFMNDEGKCTN